jgi:hypothetical protein
VEANLVVKSTPKKPHPNYILFQGFVEGMRTTLACDTLYSLLPNEGGGGFKRSIACMPPIDFSNP